MDGLKDRQAEVDTESCGVWQGDKTKAAVAAATERVAVVLVVR